MLRMVSAESSLHGGFEGRRGDSAFFNPGFGGSQKARADLVSGARESKRRGSLGKRGRAYWTPARRPLVRARARWKSR